MKIVNPLIKLSNQSFYSLRLLGTKSYIESKQSRPTYMSKFWFCGVEEKKGQLAGLEKIIKELETKSSSLKHTEKIRYFQKLVRTCSKQAPTIGQSQKIDKYLKQIFQAILQDTNWKIENLQRILQILCLNNFQKIVKRSKQREKLGQLITNAAFAKKMLQIFPSANYKIRTLILRYFSLFQFENTLYFEKLLSIIEKQLSVAIDDQQLNIEQLIKYLYSSILFINESIADQATMQQRRNSKTPHLLKSQFWTSSFKFIYDNIMLASPKMLFYLTQQIVQYCEIPNIFQIDSILGAVSEHRKGLTIIQSKNISDIVYLLQVLENVVKAKEKKLKIYEEKVRQQTILLYNQIKSMLKIEQKMNTNQKADELEKPEQPQEQKEGQSQEKTNKEITHGDEINLISVNIILESMLKLSVIDAALFSELEGIFFKAVGKAEVVNISFYIKSRVKIVKAVMMNLRSEGGEKKTEKVRLVKQQHKRFITKLIQNIEKSEKINKMEKLKLIQICQEVPIKSRKIKNFLNEFAPSSEPELRGLMEAIRDTF